LGLENFLDLDDTQECVIFKNKYEKMYTLKKTALIKMFDKQLGMFSLSPSEELVQVAIRNKKAGLAPDLPCVMHVYFFDGFVKFRDTIMSAICDINKRREWDTNIDTLEQVGEIHNQNMVMWRQVTQPIIEGYTEREIVMKRFIFRKCDKVYVYFSSCPDSAYETPAEEQDEEVSRYTQVFGMWCFEKVRNHCIVTHLQQIDFRAKQGVTVAAAFGSEETQLMRATAWYKNLTIYLYGEERQVLKAPEVEEEEEYAEDFDEQPVEEEEYE